MTSAPETAVKHDTLTLADLMTLTGPELQAIMDRGYPLDPAAMVGKQ